MIKKIDDKNEFFEYSKVDLYSIRILSLLKAYGTGYDFASFYKQIDDDGKLTAIISKLDNDITISMNKNANDNELIEFIEVIGYSSCLCAGLKDYSRNFEQGVIMLSNKKHEISLPYVQIDDYPKLMDLFNFEDYDSIDFDAWYVDVSHRIRHGCARAYTLNVNNEIISSAIFSAIYNNDAILSSVRTLPEFRHMGYASKLVSEMMSDISGNLYLMRENNKNEEFYIKLGFENIDNWRMYK